MGSTAHALILVAVSITYGVVLAGVAELVVRARGKPSPSRALAVLHRAALVVLLHGTLLFHAMAERPSAFAAAWYARGGIARTAQIIATDVLGPHGVVLLSAIALVGYVGPRRLFDLARAVVRWAKRRAAVPPRGAAVVGVLVVVASAVVDAPATSADVERAPNVVVIVLDGLRADALDARIAPNIARLAEHGTHFTRAHASITALDPAWVTLLTGLDPHDHGARGSTKVHAPDALASRFASAGYETLLLGDPTALREVDDVGVGFDPVPDTDSATRSWVDTAVASPLLAPLVQSDLAARIVPALRARTRASELAGGDVAKLAVPRARPVFAAIALSGAAAPFAARAPYYRRFTDASYRGRLKYDATLLRYGEHLDAVDAPQLRGLYEGAVAAADAEVARILRSLDGAVRPTIVALVGSRGEPLADAGRFGMTTTHVPLVIVDPRQRGRGRVDAVVRDVDLAPTLAELAGIAPTPLVDGRSLVPALRGESLPPRPAMAEDAMFADPSASLVHRQRMMRDDRFELVYTPALRGPIYALYDLADDPTESRDVAASHPVETARLRELLWSWMIRDPSMEKRAGLLVPRTVPRPRQQPAYEVASRLTEHVSNERTRRTTLGGEARTALVADGPLVFTVEVPREAKLAFAEGTTAEDGATFIVSIREADEWRELYRHRLAAPNAWSEESLDLSTYAGSSVELRLSLEAPRLPGRAFWGNPVLLRKGTAPRSVLWIAVDGLRADRAALPRVTALAREGVWFTNAHASGLGRHFGTLALLTGARPSELVGNGGATAEALDPEPFAPLTLARSRLQTRAFVERPEASAPIERALDAMFESVVPSSDDVTRAARTWMEAHADESFCAFVHYRAGPDPTRVDANIGALAQAIADAGLRDDTMIVIAGTTPSSADPEELSTVPLGIVAPGILPPLDDVIAPVRTIDVVPTLFELLGLEPHPRTSGLSFRRLAIGGTEAPRTLLAEAPGVRTLDHESFRLVERRSGQPHFQLFDTRGTPARDVTATEPDAVAEMKARLEAALANVPVVSARAPATENRTALLRLRFAGGGASRRIMGTITFGDGRTPVRSYRVRPVELAADAAREEPGKIEVAFRTDPGTLVGFDIEIDPATVPVRWQWWIDDAPWAATDVFAGFWLLPAPGLALGIDSDDARALTAGTGPRLGPDLAREVGMFVTRH